MCDTQCLELCRNDYMKQRSLGSRYSDALKIKELPDAAGTKELQSASRPISRVVSKNVLKSALTVALKSNDSILFSSDDSDGDCSVSLVYKRILHIFHLRTQSH